MPPLKATSPRPLPLWLKVLGSAFGAGHLLAIGLYALSASSGPWPTRFGDLEADAPLFAQSISSRLVYPYYLWPLRMTHNYHFSSNRVDGPSIEFEIKLKNDRGEAYETLKFPDPKANFWVRQRQTVLAQGLGNDQPVQPRGTEMIAAPQKKMPTVELFELDADNVWRLKVVPQGTQKPDAFRPSETAKILAQSYMRYYARHRGVASVELTRFSRDAIMPIVLFMPDGPPEKAFDVMKSQFGEYRSVK